MSKASGNTFKDHFCDHFNCTEADFKRLALEKMFHPPWPPLAALIYRLNPNFLRTEGSILRQISQTDNKAAFSLEISQIIKDYVRNNDYGLLRRYLKFRLSGQRMLTTATEVWEK